MKIESLQSSPSSRRRKSGFGLALLAVTGLFGCGSTSQDPTVSSAKAHFSVGCPSGGLARMVEIAHSGPIPKDPSGRIAEAVVRFACADVRELPVITQDTQGAGVCLGYAKAEHLVVVAQQPGRQAPEFFVASNGSEIGILGSDETNVTKVQLHHHDLKDRIEQGDYIRNQCEQKQP